MRLLTLLCLALLLQSCARHVERYLPSGPGTLNEGYYGGATLLVALDAGATMEVGSSPASIHPDAFKQIALGISLRIPDGVGVQLSSPEIILASREWPDARKLPIAVIEDWTTADAAARPLLPTAVIEGSARRNVHPGVGLSFMTEGTRTRTSIPAVESFELHFPEIRVNGKPIALEPVRFTAQTKRVWTLGLLGPP